MGSDRTVVDAARVSFNKRSDNYTDEQNAKLIKYLAEHNHWTPFAHPQVQLHIKAPIFVARQLGKHQVGMVWNEVSRRYVDSEPEFYWPTKWRKRAENKKQGSSDDEVKIYEKGICRNCGNFFPIKGNKHYYCSQECQSEKWADNNWAKRTVYRLKQQAVKKNVPFDLEPLDIPQPTKCSYLGIDLNYQLESIQKNSPSVDRIIPEKGYVKGNIEVISNLANMMKSYSTKEELVTFARNSLAMNGVWIQASSSEEEFEKNTKEFYKHCIDLGMCPEQARIFLPMNTLVEWYWTGSLAAWARVYNLRSKEDTQEETREIARQIMLIIRPIFPVSWEALCSVKSTT